MKSNKEHLRKCVACQEQKDKKRLLRIVKNKEEQVFIDISGKANGRGAYICKSEECLNKAKANKSLSRALKTGIANELYEEIKLYVNER